MLTKIMSLYIPGFLKKKKLNELFELTAEAFKSKPPNVSGLSFDACLLKYAIFTKEQAENYLSSGQPIEKVKQMLYQGSNDFGQKLRKSLFIKSDTDAIKTLKIIYRIIGIDFHYGSQGEFIINKCFFSKYYSEEVCELISSLDEGLSAGLSDGGRLCFYKRITGGSNCCKGCFERRN